VREVLHCSEFPLSPVMALVTSWRSLSVEHSSTFSSLCISSRHSDATLLPQERVCVCAITCFFVLFVCSSLQCACVLLVFMGAGVVVGPECGV